MATTLRKGRTFIPVGCALPAGTMVTGVLGAIEGATLRSGQRTFSVAMREDRGDLSKEARQRYSELLDADRCFDPETKQPRDAASCVPHSVYGVPADGLRDALGNLIPAAHVGAAIRKNAGYKFGAAFLEQDDAALTEIMQNFSAQVEHWVVFGVRGSTMDPVSHKDLPVAADDPQLASVLLSSLGAELEQECEQTWTEPPTLLGYKCFPPQRATDRFPDPQPTAVAYYLLDAVTLGDVPSKDNSNWFSPIAYLDDLPREYGI